MNELQMFAIILVALIAYKTLSLLLLEPLLLRVRNTVYGNSYSAGNISGSASGGFVNIALSANQSITVAGSC